jgi:phosphohistidine phosphatase
MSRLYLLRHAKAGWAAPGMRDFDRPLDATGWADAEATGVAMRERNLAPDLVLCSSARRAKETLEAVSRHLPTERVVFSDGLYATDAAGYLELIQRAHDVTSVLVVGHNPMMEDLGFALSGDGEPTARDMLASGFPASGLAVIRFGGSLAGAEPGKGFLEAFLVPAAR